jgi:hypothetical protein
MKNDQQARKAPVPSLARGALRSIASSHSFIILILILMVHTLALKKPTIGSWVYLGFNNNLLSYE